MNCLVKSFENASSQEHTVNFDQSLERCLEQGCHYYIVRSEFGVDGWEKACALFVKEPTFYREQRRMWLYNFITKSCSPCDAIPEKWSGNKFGETAVLPSFSRFELAKCPPPICH